MHACWGCGGEDVGLSRLDNAMHLTCKALAAPALGVYLTAPCQVEALVRPTAAIRPTRVPDCDCAGHLRTHQTT